MNESVTNVSADDGNLYCKCTTAEYFWAADWRRMFVLVSYFYIILSILMTRSARDKLVISMIQKRMDKLREIWY